MLKIALSRIQQENSLLSERLEKANRELAVTLSVSKQMKNLQQISF
jgi:hypothetical protein